MNTPDSKSAILMFATPKKKPVVGPPESMESMPSMGNTEVCDCCPECDAECDGSCCDQCTMGKEEDNAEDTAEYGKPEGQPDKMGMLAKLLKELTK